MTASDIRFIYDPALAGYELAGDHPFKPLRYRLTHDLLRDSGILKPEEVVTPPRLDESALLAVHDRRYVEIVKSASVARVTTTDEFGNVTADRSADTSLATYGLGSSDNPVFAGMHDAIMGICAATTAAIELVASGAARRSANFAGGLHHAAHARASGFCVYNDLAVGIRRAVDHHGLRIAYIDLDAHHGDGVQWLFYDEPRVLTISLHESGRYLFPGTGHTYETGRDAGRGTSINLPLEPFTEDDSYLESFDAVVPRALENFGPDLIVLQAGADTHRHDPLADLSLTLAGMSAAYRRVVDLAEDHAGGRLVITGGGGYDPYRTVPRAWAHAWSALSGRELPVSVPESWRAQWGKHLGVELPEGFNEEPGEFAPSPRSAAIASRNRSVAQRLLNTIEPLWAAEPLKAGSSTAPESRKAGSR